MKQRNKRVLFNCGATIKTRSDQTIELKKWFTCFALNEVDNISLATTAVFPFHFPQKMKLVMQLNTYASNKKSNPSLSFLTINSKNGTNFSDEWQRMKVEPSLQQTFGSLDSLKVQLIVAWVFEGTLYCQQTMHH